MDIEKIHLQFVLHLKVWVFVICFLSVSACSIGTPRYTKPFVFEQGLKRLEIDVDQQDCGYAVGISFTSKAEGKDGGQAIRKFFGTPTRGINMPATVDISLLDEHGKRVFSRVDFGGVGLSWYYGANPLKFIANRGSLDPGKYIAMINIKDIDGDFSGFESAFFILGDPKTTCREANLWTRWTGLLDLLWDSNWSLPSKNVKKSPNNVERNMSVAQTGGHFRYRQIFYKDHNKLVDKRYAEDSECFREEFRESIYKRVVVKGMWPAEAFLAGGGGIYRVKADPKKWEKRAYPRLVMKAQCTDPDDSEIEIDFRNSSQYSGGVVRKFTVRFENGVVIAE